MIVSELATIAVTRYIQSTIRSSSAMYLGRLDLNSLGILFESTLFILQILQLGGRYKRFVVIILFDKSVLEDYHLVHHILYSIVMRY